jgi:FtsP/CotA-like multicopper oxidase with cupredoxin domain
VERHPCRPIRDALTTAGPAVAVVVAVMVVGHAVAGSREVGEPPLLLHVVRDTVLAVPAALVLAVVVLRALAHRRRTVRAAAGSAAVGVAVAAGVFVHGWVFPEVGHAHGGGLSHNVGEAIPAAVAAVGIAYLLGRRRARTERRLRWAPLGLAVATIASLVAVGGNIATADKGAAQSATATDGGAQFNNPDLKEDELADITQPCQTDSPLARPFSVAMPIPPALTPVPTPTSDQYDITEEASTAEIIPGITTPVWGYDGLVPGPTIMARKGRPALVTFRNRLPFGDDANNIEFDPPLDPKDHPFIPSSTVVHLHGINDEPVSDGYPELRRVPPGQPAAPDHPPNPSDQLHHYDNDQFQLPATLWYHDHSVHITSEHIYRGLAGFYIHTDEAEDALPLPKGYGVKDIPLLLKDVMIDPENGKLLYNNCSHHGAYGDVMTVNGKQQPRFEVGTAKYRFRTLDGSDARQYEVALRPADRLDDPSADQPFVVLGSDHGLLAAPEPVKEFHITPSERVEFGVDFSKYPVGTRLVMVNELVEPDKPWFPLMAFDVTRVEHDNSQFVGRPQDALQSPVRTREFHFNRQGGYFSINSRQFDPNRDDALPVVNTAEDWILVNESGGWGHPIHIHLGRFKILSIDGRDPFPGEDGWKDTVWLGPNQTIRVRPEFANFTGRYVFHCHNGSHEDHDMMSQFNVQPG